MAHTPAGSGCASVRSPRAGISLNTWWGHAPGTPHPPARFRGPCPPLRRFPGRLAQVSDEPSEPPDDEDPITQKLRALRRGPGPAPDPSQAMLRPRVTQGRDRKRYFVHECPQCGADSYHHLDRLDGPTGPAAELESAWCEDCGVVTMWTVLAGLPDGSTRVLGPDFGAEGPPSPKP